MPGIPNPFRLLSRLFRRLASRGAYQLEAAILGPTRPEVWIVGRELLNTESGATNVFQATGPDVDRLRDGADPASVAATSVKSVPAFYYPEGGRGHVRRWMVHLPNGENGGETVESADPAKPDWRRTSDVVVVAWPYRLLGQREDVWRPLLFHLGGVIGHARARGRLRRVGILVTDVPDQYGPHHRMQVRLDPRDLAHLPPVRGTARRARRVTRPGALSDPNWRSFLHQEVATDPGLGRLRQNLRQVMGAPSPLFFLRQGMKPPGSLEPMARWMEGRRPRGAGAGERWLHRALCLGASCCAAIFLTCLFSPGPSGRGSGTAATFSRPDFPEHLRRREAQYNGWIVRSAGVIRGAERVDVPRALERASLVVEARVYGDSLAQMTEAFVESLRRAGASDSVRVRTAQKARETVDRHLRLQADWRGRAIERTSACDPSSWDAVGSLRPWNDAMKDALVLNAALSFRYAKGDSLLMQPRADLASIVTELRSREAGSEADLLDTLACVQDAATFYRVWRSALNTRSGPELRRVERGASVVCLPPIERIKSACGKARSRGPRSAVLGDQIQDLRRTLNESPFRQRVEAKEVRNALCSYTRPERPAPRDITIQFCRPDADLDWHIDWARVEGAGEREVPESDPSTSPELTGEVACCRATISNCQPDQVIRVSLAEGSVCMRQPQNKRCVGSEVRSICISDSSGTLTMGTAGVVNWAVVSDSQGLAGGAP